MIEYVNALADDAAAHTEKLGDVGELIKGDDDLLNTPKRTPTKKNAPKKTTPRVERREIIRKAGAKDRKVLDRLRDHDKKP